MARILAVFNQAGGVGKTTLTRDLGFEFATRGSRVLLIDADPQASLTEFLGVDADSLEASLFDALLHDAVPTIVRVHGLDVLPSSIDLAAADFLLAAEIGRELKLRQVVEKISASYDLIFIDAPPSLGNISINVLVAADEILIPVQCEIKALRGTRHLFDTIDRVRTLNPKLKIAGVVPTLLDRRTRLNTESYEVLKNRLGDRLTVFAPIRRGVAFAEASAHGVPVHIHAPTYDGIADIRALADALEI
ncbi:MAG: ParA family protein [Blastocatellia bacterium]|nr:ParA family protein [Blastocatellia bacterium]